MSLDLIQQTEADRLVATYARHPVLFTHGRGMILFDSQGKRYLDMLSGIGVNILGHAHPVIKKAITKQSGRMLHVSNLFYHEHQAALADYLAQISGMDRVFFSNSGTEAIEAALKMARAHAQQVCKYNGKAKWRILALNNSFHGRTYAALSVTGQKKYRDPFKPLVPGVRFVTPNDVNDLKKKFDATVCAVLLEPIQGEGGIRQLTPQFLKAARALTRKSGAALIFDEIQCGLGRTGQWFACQASGVQPDIIAVAKPLAGGLPLGAILTTKKMARAFQPGMHGTTFGGGPLACVVGLAVLQTIQGEGLLKQARQMGLYFRRGLEMLAKQHVFVRDVRGVGLMLGMELDSAARAKDVVTIALDKGVILNRTNDTVLRFLPPLIVQKIHIDVTIATLSQIFNTMGD